MEPNLKTLQAGILSATGLSHVRCIFLSFTNDAAAINSWLASSVAALITPTESQLQEKADYRTGTGGSSLITTFSISQSGLDKIGAGNLPFLNSDSFRNRMRSAVVRQRLNDPPTQQWDPGYRRVVDAVFVLVSNSLRNLDRIQFDISRDLTPNIGSVIQTETGSMIDRGGYHVEPFGYADGINQPTFFGENRRLVGNWRDFLVNEAGADYGSYLVFRKLEQDVSLFESTITELAATLGISAEEAGAQAIGRFRNGMPLTLSSDAFGGRFSYGVRSATEDSGNRCPFHAHIRKANPRDNGSTEPIIVRRGIPYDEGVNPPAPQPVGRPAGVGLLFMCYQSNIEEQYEAIQMNLNAAGFPPVQTDPIAGQGPRLGQPTTQRWNHGDGSSTSTFRFPQVVVLRGGEYFYTPSISFLRNRPVPRGVGRLAPAAPAGALRQKPILWPSPRARYH